MKISKTSRKIFIWFTFILVIILSTYAFFIFTNKAIRSEIQIIAHRGGAAYFPQNTIAAFKNAIEDGVVDWLEMDIQETKDGILIVYHDNNVSQLGEGQVGEYSLAEMQSFEISSGQRVPTFEEVIALAKEHDTNIMPEAKNPAQYPGIEKKMIDLLTEANYFDHTIVQSFSPTSIEEFHRLAPELNLCILYGLSHLQMNLKPPYPGDADFLCVMSEMIFLNPAMISQAHQNDRQVFVYLGVFDQTWAMRLAIALGVDGLMPDAYLTLADILEN